MKIETRKHLTIALLLFAGGLLAGCGGGSDGDSNNGSSNSAPVADIDSAKTGGVGDTISFDGSGSSDADGDSLTYEWVLTPPSGSTAVLDDDSAESVSFVADLAGAYTIELTVSDGADDDTATSSATIASTVDCTAEPDDLECAWIMNESDERSTYIYENDMTSTRALVNVQSAESAFIESQEYVHVSATGVPNYSVEITTDIKNFLDSRPNKATDFVSGSTTVNVGDVVEFGEDIGYKNLPSQCGAGAGKGYWPPGPACPEDVGNEAYFTRDPQDNGGEDCSTEIGNVGFWVNGTAVFGWGDAQSYNDEGVWQTLAPVAEVYDVDICGGHAAQGEYHHHFYSQCLADLVGDDGTDHSPLYGYALDGYPIYGPYVSNGTLAISSWVTRDYDTPGATGCGTAKKRTCTLRDPYDVSAGFDIVMAGPDTDGNFTSLSGNDFVTESGFFMQDYYWDETLTDSGGAYLDQYNGHTDSERGYHYHITLQDDGAGGLEPAFPFTVGMKFAGELPDANNLRSCSGPM